MRMARVLLGLLMLVGCFSVAGCAGADCQRGGGAAEGE